MPFNLPTFNHLNEEEKTLFLSDLVQHSFEHHKMGFWQPGFDDLWKARFERVQFVWSFDAFKGGPLPLIRFYNNKESKDCIEILIKQKDWPIQKDVHFDITLIFQNAIETIRETRSYNQGDATPKQLFQKFIFEDGEKGFPELLKFLHEIEYSKLHKKADIVPQRKIDAL